MKVTPATIQSVLDDIKQALQAEVEAKSDVAFASAHETLGVLTEEYTELIEAVRTSTGVSKELMDIIVAALWGLASKRQGAWTW
jgi:hypothetical protein